MHLTEIFVDEILEAGGLPCSARGRATFTNGRTYPFEAHFAHGYAALRITVHSPTDGKPISSSSRHAQAIHDRLGWTEIARREREAIVGFEWERYHTCQALLPDAKKRDPHPRAPAPPPR